jgi:hypothetical protein
VSFAAADVTEPWLFLTTTRYRCPLRAAFAVKEYDDFVAWATAAQRAPFVLEYHR